jgi:signal peptidase complex subunit 3
LGLADYFHVANPTVTLDYLGVDALRAELNYDRAYPVFNLTADLQSQFSWNTKQLFVYVTVDFETEMNPSNSGVLWNTIIQRKENAILSVPSMRAGFPFAVTDQEKQLRGREFSVKVAWHVMPRVGALFMRSKTFTGFKFVEEYV